MEKEIKDLNKSVKEKKGIYPWEIFTNSSGCIKNINELNNVKPSVEKS